MILEDLIGRRVTLLVRRFGPAGAFLAVDDDDETTILLPEREVPNPVHEGDPVVVFVYLDSEDRPIATVEEPKLALGEVTFLEVSALTDIGAFFNWGLPKELLVPFAQQSRDLHVGEREPIGLYLDHSGRLAGTMFVSDLLEGDHRPVALDEWVIGEAWRNDPDIGLFVIVERSFVALVPASEPHRLRRGESGRFRVTAVLPDGKVVLSLRQHAYQELETDAKTILAVLAQPGAPRVGDRSDPETIRALFGLSKKAFKRAAGRLLKEKTATIDADGCLVVRKPHGQ